MPDLPDWMREYFGLGEPTMPQQSWPGEGNPVGTETLRPPQQLGAATPIDQVDPRLHALTGMIRTASEQTAGRNVRDVMAGALGDAGPVGGISGGALGTFAGMKAKNAPMEALDKARALERWGASPELVNKLSGWGRNADGNWRFEIPDADFGITQGSTKPGEMGEIGRVPKGRMLLPELLDHPDLFAQYPQLKQTIVRPYYGGQALGMHTPTSFLGAPSIIGLAPQATPKLYSTLMHEVQHGVQDIENAPRGASPEFFRNDSVQNALPAYLRGNEMSLYNNTAGEVEARTTQARLGLNTKARNNFNPLDDEKVPRQSQIVIKPSTTGGSLLRVASDPPNLKSSSLQVPGQDLNDPLLRSVLKELALDGWIADSKAGPNHIFRKPSK